jgi:ankyrin repeat protein
MLDTIMSLQKSAKVLGLDQMTFGSQPHNQEQKANALSWCIFKRQFAVALQMIECGADCLQLNQNQSNLLHILFANYEGGDLFSAGLMAEALCTKGVDPNLIDLEGKSPLHVAVRKG